MMTNLQRLRLVGSILLTALSRNSPIEAEIDGDDRVNRVTIPLSRLELPLAKGFHRSFVVPTARHWFNHGDLINSAVLPNTGRLLGSHLGCRGGDSHLGRIPGTRSP